MNFEQFKREYSASVIKNDKCFNHLYASNALSGEAGEYANMIKKLVRDGPIKAPTKEERLKEIFDVMFYCAYAIEIEGSTFERVFDLGFEKLRGRRSCGIHGNGLS